MGLGSAVGTIFLHPVPESPIVRCLRSIESSKLSTCFAGVGDTNAQGSFR